MVYFIKRQSGASSERSEFGAQGFVMSSILVWLAWSPAKTVTSNLPQPSVLWLVEDLSNDRIQDNDFEVASS